MTKQGDVLSRKQKIITKKLSEMFEQHDIDDSDEIEIKLPFYKSFLTFWNIFGGLCTQIFYSQAPARVDLESSVT